MEEIRIPKLRLSKEVLRPLGEPELRRVNGGVCSDACIDVTECDCYDPDPTIPSACLHTCSW